MRRLELVAQAPALVVVPWCGGVDFRLGFIEEDDVHGDL
jgi:hypothetical protein